MEIQIYDVAVVGIIISIIEVAKQAGLPTKYCPIVALILGTLVGALYLSNGDIKRGIVIGVACGLSASGLYDNIKIPLKKEGK